MYGFSIMWLWLLRVQNSVHYFEFNSSQKSNMALSVQQLKYTIHKYSSYSSKYVPE